ncbi:MAG: TIGR00153 family protein [Candidatus Thermoplasmatota archaeon]|nr:TIGR00153 family protein [Candidatus Thermoplasmatota archaeon]
MVRNRNILDWFGRKEEKEALEKARSHMDKVCETVQALDDAVNLLFDGKTDEAKTMIHTVREKEHEADNIRRALFDFLSSGVMAPTDREDLTHLIEMIDDIADWANDAGKLYSLIDEKIPGDIAQKLHTQTNVTLRCILKTKEAVSAMVADPKSVLALCNEVEFLEEECDDIEKDLFATTIHNKNLSPSMLILLHDIIASVETISDKGEDTADILRVLLVKQQ